MTVQQLAGVAEFSVVADPRRARHVVGLRLPEDTREPRPALLALHHGLRRLQGDYGPRSTAPADVAQVIAVHPRTVQRGLMDEGRTFAEILDRQPDRPTPGDDYFRLVCHPP